MSDIKVIATFMFLFYFFINVLFLVLRLLKHFYSFEDQDKASFPGQGHQVSLGLMSTFPSALLFGVSFAVCMTFKEARSMYCKVGAVSLLAGLVWVSVRS